MSEQQLTERLNVPVSPEMAKAVDDYFHEQRFRSKADAIRRLLEFALEKQPKRKV